MALAEKRLLKESAYYKLDKLVLEMRQAKTGLQMKQQKSFFTTVKNACTGKELVVWIKERLHIINDSVALHLATMLCHLGYVIPVAEKSVAVRLDTSCFRIQRPALWPSRKWDTSSQEYAVYLLKKSLKNKPLENYEQTALTNLERVHANTWQKLRKQAQDCVSKYNFSSKDEREIEDSQERAYWRLHRPPPGQKPHHYGSDGMMKKSICMEAIIQNNKQDVLRKKVNFLRVYVQKTISNPDQATSTKTLNTLVNYCVKRKRHDPLLSEEETFALSPWVAIDEYFYEDLLEFDQKCHTQLDVEAWSLSFSELMKDRHGKQMFASFLHQEYSRENLLFWEACEDVKQSPRSKSAAKISRIVKDFLMPSAAHEVNLDTSISQTTLEAVKNNSRWCLDAAQQHIYTLMKEDSYPRFLKSQIYQSCLEHVSEERKSFSQSIRKFKNIRRFPFYHHHHHEKITLRPGAIRVRSAAGAENRRVVSSPPPGRRRATVDKIEYHHRFTSANNLSSPSSHTSDNKLSPFHLRKHSSSADNYPMRKAGSLSSLVVNSERQHVADDDSISTDSGIAISRSRPGSLRKVFSGMTTLRKKISLH